MARPLPLFFALLVVAAAACDCGGAAGGCDAEENDCPPGEVCAPDGRCLPAPACDEAAGESACGIACCPPGDACVAGACEERPPACEAGETACGAACCADGRESCVQGSCVDDSLLTGCTDSDECQGDTFCDVANGRCVPFGLPGGPVNDEACTFLVPLGVFNPAIQCEWLPEDSLTPCTLEGVVGNPGYPSALRAPACPGREVCVDPDLRDGSEARVCMDPHRQVLATPAVIRFRFPPGSRGNPDGSATNRPSLVFPSYDALDGGARSGTSNGVLRIVDGETCRTQYTIDGIDDVTGFLLHTMGSSPVAVGDVDRAPDGRPEIVAHAQGGGLWAFTYDEQRDEMRVLWHSKNPDGSVNRHNRGARSVDAFGFESFSVQHWSGPALHDLDDDGVPEVLMSAAVFDAQGTLLFEPSDALESDFRFVATGQHPVVADVDLDGRPDLVTGDGVFHWQSAGAGEPGAWVPAAGYQRDAGGFDGFVAVGDFGSFPRRDGTPDSGQPEIVVVNNNGGGVYVQTSDGQIVFGPYPVPGGGLGGPPTVGDFDGDGRAEFAEAGGRAYTIFDLDCVVESPQVCDDATPCGAGLSCPVAGRCARSSAPCDNSCEGGEECIQLFAERQCVPEGCQGNGVRWSQVSQDLSSNRTGSSIFDFEADGEVEAVYADECYTRIYRGTDGVVLFSQFHSSCTWYENAIVADVDGDLRSEIVVGSNENCGSASTCFDNALQVRPGVRVDPIFPGLRCAEDADCTSGACVDELCRCQSDLQCGGGDFVCSPVLAGSTSVTDQQVCRAAYRLEDADGRPGIAGVRIYKDALDRWVGSRPIWNQHTYSITNVEDDGRIPRSSQVQNNWQVPGLNNYRQNVQGDVDPAAIPDLTGGDEGSGACVTGDDGALALVLPIRVCNRGTLDVGQGVPVAVYEGSEPDAEDLRCLLRTTSQLAPGSCEALACTISPAPIATPTDYLVVVDDDGAGASTRAECREGNNRVLLRGRTCLGAG
jgi:hypothetical protein